MQKAFEVLRAEAEPALSADATLNPTVAAANYHQRAGYYKALNDLIGLKNPPPKQKNTQVPLLATSLDEIPNDFNQY